MLADFKMPKFKTNVQNFNFWTIYMDNIWQSSFEKIIMFVIIMLLNVFNTLIKCGENLNCTK